MKIAVTARRCMLLAALGLVGVTAIPSTASAANLTCKGHTKLGTVSDDAENPVDFAFACTGRIVGYTVISDRELDYFDPEQEVHDAAGNVVASDGFGCEGDFPGVGVNCLGTYSANNIAGGTVSVNDQKPCDEPRPHLQLVVVAESLDATTGAPKKNSNGAMAGPFDLGRPHGCPKSSELAGMLAIVEELRNALRSSASGATFPRS